MNAKTLHVVTGTTHPDCPPWCAQHWDSDKDALRGVPFSIYRHHISAEIVLHATDPDAETTGQDILFRAERYDGDYTVGTCAVYLGTRCDRDGSMVDLLNIPLSLDSAQAFADQLLKAVAQALTAAPERPANKIDGSPWGECIRCGHEFELDSSPNVDHCWSCAEILDAETDPCAEARTLRAQLKQAVDRLNALTEAVLAR
jgi:hypothetical protein